jgi:hypothetical protein
LYYKNGESSLVKQSKKASLVESVVSTSIGFVVSMGILEGVNQIWGLSLNLTDNVAITSIFTAASVLRSYLVRRLFNWWHHRGSPDEFPPVTSFSTGRWMGPPPGLSLVDQLQWIDIFDAGVRRASVEASEAIKPVI